MIERFKEKKIFITGHTGFKGSWLSFWLSELGAYVKGYAHPPSDSFSLFEGLGLEGRIVHEVGDIRNYSQLKDSILQFQPDFVFHLAAQALVQCSYQDPLLTFSTNVIGSTYLLEAVRACSSVRSLVYITSDKCYQNQEWLWGYRETDALGGVDPYSASKACAEMVFQSYYLSYFKDRQRFGCSSARAGNVIGGGDRSIARIVPDIIKSIEDKVPVILRNPDATRPWQHVMDPLYGYMILALNLYDDPQKLNGEPWNFGPLQNSVRTVYDLAQLLTNAWDGVRIEVSERQNLKHESTLLHLSIEKAQALLRWSPLYNFETAVKKTAEWYIRTQQGEPLNDIMRDQIQEYMDQVVSTY